MGIKNLNRFLKDECKESIKFISLAELSGKKIAIDISIYMFKYASEDALIENIYLMLSIFRHYNIIPIFVFDGKPPTEKKDLIQKRREDKIEAVCEYNHLKEKLSTDTDMDDIEKQEIISNMDLLKKKFININKNDFDIIKKLIIAYGATYYEASGEADELCALLVIKNKVWACLSEDMDMFVYGCTRVIRYLSLLNHTAVLYDQKGILDNLGITQKELREICVLSGTDYNINTKNNIQLYNTLKLFKKYSKKSKNNIEFYDWLIENSKYIDDYDYLTKINNMFDITHNSVYIDILDDIKIVMGSIIYSDIKEILKTDGFIFPQ